MRNLFSEKAKDRIADRVIRIGGILVILVVAAIVLNIGWQALPLFGGADSGPLETVAPAAGIVAAGSDSRFAVTWTLARTGAVRLLGPGAPAPFALEIAGPIAAADQEIHGLVSLVDTTGVLRIGEVRLRDRWDGDQRSLEARWRAAADPLPLAEETRWTGVTANRNADGAVVALAWDDAGALRAASWDPDDQAWSTLELAPAPAGVTAAAVAEDLAAIAVADGGGALHVWRPSPLAALPVEGLAGRVSALRFLIGGGTLIAAGADGSLTALLQVSRIGLENTGTETVAVAGRRLAPGNRTMVVDDGIGQKLATRSDLRLSSAPPLVTAVRELPSLAGRPTVIAPSHRGRSFLVGSELGEVGLFHSTSARRLLRQRWGAGPVTALALAPKGDGAVAVVDATLQRRSIDNPHPEVSLRTLFLPVWYEGYTGPRWVWQSTGGSDAFEPKLSLWPLIFGTFKATFYAMVLSVPLALMAAIYVSQLAPRWLQNSVKPTLELMAAVPSVVVGFLAALWLAPHLERALLATALAAVLVPASIGLALAAWRLLPVGWRRWLPDGSELAVLVAAAGVVLLAVPVLAHALEQAFFGGDLQRYLFTELGLRYDQRNSLVVGLALGFAVIPVIFTIAEDACSSVPRSLVTASRALGATRWQTAIKLVMPAASPGLFAAVMLGFGRAVGETMIVLMAAGNTPLLDMSPFNGMRTMSAAIAVEIPEAPVGGTLFRVLFLTGILLFAFTLVLSTAADLIGTHLRRRYARF